MKSLISAFSAGCASVGSEADNIKKTPRQDIATANRLCAYDIPLGLGG